jgi:hypothetical protein
VARILARAHRLLEDVGDKVLKAYGVSSKQGRTAEQALGIRGSGNSIQRLRSALEDGYARETYGTPAHAENPYYGQQSEWGKILQGDREVPAWEKLGLH